MKKLRHFDKWRDQQLSRLPVTTQLVEFFFFFKFLPTWNFYSFDKQDLGKGADSVPGSQQEQ